MSAKTGQMTIITQLFIALILALTACGGTEEAPIAVPEGAGWEFGGPGTMHFPFI